jgi:SAM-dependent methyltransferase
MFSQSADIYDLVYSFKDYKQESEDIRSAIRSTCPSCTTILDIACGTGEHHKHLSAAFIIDGMDFEAAFLEIARPKNPKGQYFKGDMKDFSTGKKYDVVLCLFSSIGYLRDEAEIVKALRCFKEHLNPGGVMMVEPWFTRETWKDGKAHMITYDKDGLKICRMNRSSSAGKFSLIDFHYLVGSDEKDVYYFTERHELRMSSKEEMLNAFDEAGLEVRYEEKGLTGRGMYYAYKKQTA